MNSGERAINTPAQREDMLDRAVEALQQNRNDDAVNLCKELIETNASDAEAWSFFGVALARSDEERGLEALRKAVQLEPSNAQWHLNLGLTLTAAGHFEIAEGACRKAVELSSGALDALIPWADALTALGRLEDAAEVLKKVIEVEASPVSYRRLAHVHHHRGDLQGGVNALDAIFDMNAATPDDHLLRARLNMQLQHFDRAEADFSVIADRSPEHPEIAVLLSTFERSKGNIDAARQILDDAYRNHRYHPRLLAAMLDDEGDAASDVMADAETIAGGDALSLQDRRLLTFSLARAYDRHGEIDRAWETATRANRLYDGASGFNLETYERQVEDALAVTANTTSLNVYHGPELVYIVGAPRTGATLLQTLLASAPQTVSVGERGALIPWLLSILDQPAESQLAVMQANGGQLRDADLHGMQSIASGNRYIDKSPHHAHLIGLIQRIHPHARFVDCRRDLRDVAMSIFFHDFSPAFDYARDMKNIVAYLMFQRQTIDRWAESGMPVTIHDHDAFVRDPATVAAGTFSALGMTFDPGYLETEERNAIVQTFSVNQVRDEITPARVGRWERYAAHVDEVFTPLGYS